MDTVELPRIDRSLIEQVRDRIVDACHPKAIYLFGSAARGQVREGSDLDLLVVVDLPEGTSTWDKASELHGLFWGWLVPMDLIVLTPAMFERSRNIPGGIGRIVLQEGELLYYSQDGGDGTT
ncbi:MAG TPA: nucleotidyltransferase domain-containing protein [Rhodothermales bacterium]|nr:nucleotidyltransferase domain-containing protein [Rhodothermales bacterium]